MHGSLVVIKDMKISITWDLLKLCSKHVDEVSPPGGVTDCFNMIIVQTIRMKNLITFF